MVAILHQLNRLNPVIDIEYITLECYLPFVKRIDAETVVAAELVGAALASSTIGMRLVLGVDAMRKTIV